MIGYLLAFILFVILAGLGYAYYKGYRITKS